MSAPTKDNCPPQFVFEIMVSQAARRFLVEDKSAEEIVAEIVAAFEDLYSNDALVTDMTVEIDDVDLLLVSYIWFATNYESLRVERKKKQLFGNPLKGKPRLLARVYTMTTNFRTYTLSVAQKHAPFRPDSWKPEDEVEFESIFSRLFPKPKDENKRS